MKVTRIKLTLEVTENQQGGTDAMTRTISTIVPVMSLPQMIDPTTGLIDVEFHRAVDRLVNAATKDAKPV